MRHWRIISKEARAADIERRVTHFILYLFAPLVIAIAGAFTHQLFTYNTILCIILWVAIAVVYGASWWIARPSDRALLALVRDAELARTDRDDKNASIEGLTSSLSRFIWMSKFSLVTTRMIANYRMEKAEAFDHFKEAVSELFYPLLNNLEAILSTKTSEHWSFAVYLYSQSNDILEPIWIDRSRFHPSEGAGRSWGRGEGHVGKTFVNRSAIVTEDATHPDVRALSSTPREMSKDHDETAYRSFASIPIGPVSDESDVLPLGVLVATSSTVGRFNQGNTQILAQLAETLATILSVNHIDLDAMKNASEHSSGGGAKNDA